MTLELMFIEARLSRACEVWAGGSGGCGIASGLCQEQRVVTVSYNESLEWYPEGRRERIFISTFSNIAIKSRRIVD